jgi:hypothetical protein
MAKKVAISLLLLLSVSVSFAHGGMSSLWDSTTFAYFITAIVTGVCYIAMVWDPKAKKDKEKDKG